MPWTHRHVSTLGGPISQIGCGGVHNDGLYRAGFSTYLWTRERHVQGNADGAPPGSSVNRYEVSPMQIPTPRIPRRTRRWSPLATLGVAASIVMLTATSAQADTISLTHDASGTAHMASTDSDIALGPTTLQTAIDTDTLTFTGSMELPPTRTEFKAVGLLPVSADVTFEQVGDLEGTLEDLPNGTAAAHATATYHIRLSNIDIVGFPTFTGPYCRTIDPVEIPVDTPEGEEFNVIQGGTLAGEFDVGPFQHCGLNTALINLLVPGSGNTVEFEISNGRVG